MMVILTFRGNLAASCEFHSDGFPVGLDDSVAENNTSASLYMGFAILKLMSMFE